MPLQFTSTKNVRKKSMSYLGERTLKRTEVRAPMRDVNAAVKSDTMVAIRGALGQRALPGARQP
jgi:hypothetical protein